MKKFEEIYDFIDRAEKSRKYPPNTAQGLRAALRLFEAEINEEERGSLEKFTENLDQIYQMVYSKNKTFSAGSLATYKSRILKVLSDYEKYGGDPVKMNSWSPKVINRAPKTAKEKNSTKKTLDDKDSLDLPESALVNMNRVELTLRPNTKAIILVPSDLSKEECQKIKNLLDSLTQ